jgi:hypothetical protein
VSAQSASLAQTLVHVVATPLQAFGVAHEAVLTPVLATPQVPLAGAPSVVAHTSHAALHGVLQQ